MKGYKPSLDTYLFAGLRAPGASEIVESGKEFGKDGHTDKKG